MAVRNVIDTDVLVIGGGVAGCFAAINASEHGLDVTLVDKAYAGKSGASIAAGGWWLLFHPEWGHDLKAAMDAVNKKSEYLNNPEWTEVLLKDSWDAYQDLLRWGLEAVVDIDKVKGYEKSALANYNIDPIDSPLKGIPLGNNKIMPVLRRQEKKSGIKIIDRTMITDLLKNNGRVIGAIGFSLDNQEMYCFVAKATVLSGGNNNFRSYGYHTNCLSGDADGMAYRAGAEITGKEFPDLHFNFARYPAWTTSAMRYGQFYYFTDSEEKYIEHFGLDLSMAFAVHAGKGPVFWNLDAANPEDIRAMQEGARRRENPIELDRISLDFSQGGKYPVRGGAAAGFTEPQTSGIWVIDTNCTTTLPGLYAAGDCCGTRACGSIHTRGGWGLAGAGVTGKRAGASAAKYALQAKKPIVDDAEFTKLTQVMFAPSERRGGFSPRWVTQLLQNTMIPYFILHIKHGERLGAALTIVEFLRDHLVPQLTARDAHELRLAHETRNMVLNAEMILRASLFRTESRGQHYREDYPQRDDPSWLVWVKLKQEQGGMKPLKEMIPQKWWPDLAQPYLDRYPRRFPNEQLQ